MAEITNFDERWNLTGEKQAPSSLKYQMRRDFDALTDRVLRHPVVKRMEILKIKDPQIPLKINRISIWETSNKRLPSVKFEQKNPHI